MFSSLRQCVKRHESAILAHGQIFIFQLFGFFVILVDFNVRFGKCEELEHKAADCRCLQFVHKPTHGLDQYT